MARLFGQNFSRYRSRDGGRFSCNCRSGGYLSFTQAGAELFA
jgi:hypothetical protein